MTIMKLQPSLTHGNVYIGKKSSNFSLQSKLVYHIRQDPKPYQKKVSITYPWIIDCTSHTIMLLQEEIKETSVTIILYKSTDKHLCKNALKCS